MIKVTRSKLTRLFLVLIIITVFFLITYFIVKQEKKSKKTLNTNILTVETKPNVSTLYYTALIAPITKEDVSLNKNQGVITQVGFTYGGRVKKGQLLFVINSESLAKEYQDALSSYIKAMKVYSDTSFEMEGATALNKLKIISQQEFLTTQTKLFNANLDAAQAERKLNDVFQNAGISNDILKKIDYNNPKSIIAALKNAPEYYSIYAPFDGTAILPTSKEDKTAKPFSVGQNVKIGETLVSIIDENGSSYLIKVLQQDINKIYRGQKATITSDGCPGVTLHGVVQHKSRTANQDISDISAIPTFNVLIVTSEETPYQEQNCRVGMRAEITLALDNPPSIKVPITAVIMKNGQAIVDKINKKTKKIEPVTVETGPTGLDSIEITKGLHSGDEILVNAKNTD